MMTPISALPDIGGVLAAEQARGEALVQQDFMRLKSMLSADLVHVHTKGNQDSREGYLHFVSKVIEVVEVQRHDLTVQMHGDVAVMAGRQMQTSRMRGRDESVTLESQVMQVWKRVENDWVQLAFQATPIAPSVPTAVGNK